jgi:hypothetical protein
MRVTSWSGLCFCELPHIDVTMLVHRVIGYGRDFVSYLATIYSLDMPLQNETRSTDPQIQPRFLNIRSPPQQKNHAVNSCNIMLVPQHIQEIQILQDS